MPELSPFVRVVVVVSQDNADNPLRMARVDTITSAQADAAARARALGDRAAAAGHRLPNLSATMTSWFVPLPEEIVGLIRDLYDGEPCWYDRHGYCQEHGWNATTPVCPHARANGLLERVDHADDT
jgi:hypothetical protein